MTCERTPRLNELTTETVLSRLSILHTQSAAALDRKVLIGTLIAAVADLMTVDDYNGSALESYVLAGVSVYDIDDQTTLEYYFGEAGIFPTTPTGAGWPTIDNPTDPGFALVVVPANVTLRFAPYLTGYEIKNHIDISAGGISVVGNNPATTDVNIVFGKTYGDPATISGVGWMSGNFRSDGVQVLENNTSLGKRVNGELGAYNTIIGEDVDNNTGNRVTVIGTDTDAGGFDDVTILGEGMTALADGDTPIKGSARLEKGLVASAFHPPSTITTGDIFDDLNAILGDTPSSNTAIIFAHVKAITAGAIDAEPFTKFYAAKRIDENNITLYGEKMSADQSDIGGITSAPETLPITTGSSDTVQGYYIRA